MSGFEDLLGSALGGGALSKIAAQLGTDEAGAQSAITAALPQIMGQLHQNASTAEGADTLHQLIGQYDGSVLDNVGAHIDSGDADGSQAAIASRVFGAEHEAQINALAGQTGLSPAKAGGLIGMLAPLVLGALSKSGAGAGGAGGLSSMLGGLVAGSGGGIGAMLGGLLGGGGASALSGNATDQTDLANGAAVPASGAASAATGSGGVIGQISKAIDRDGDGNPLNDVQAMAKGGFVQKLLGLFKKS
jgi:hypothetical protein